MRERKLIRRTESAIENIDVLCPRIDESESDQLLKNRLNVKKKKKQKFERRIKVHQRKDLLKKEQCIKKVLGLDRVVLQDKFTTPAMLVFNKSMFDVE